MTERFPVIAPSEEVVLTFDFSTGLDVGENLVGPPDIEITMELGVDANASGIVGVAEVSGAQVLVPVSGMKVDCDYHFVVTMQTTNTNKTLAVGQILPVRKA